jgi:hypothetical protein
MKSLLVFSLMILSVITHPADALGEDFYPAVFKPGRSALYSLKWNSIPIGEVKIDIDGSPFDHKGDTVFKVTLRTFSNEFLSMIYKVDDTYISYMDPKSMVSRYYEADRKEGLYKKHLVVEYDHGSGRARHTNLTDGSVKFFPVSDEQYDPISCIFYFMYMPVREGDLASINVSLNEKNYRITGKIGKKEIIKVPGAGDIEVFKVVPYIYTEGKILKKGHGYIYFSVKDRMPVHGVIFTPFGSVSASLRSVADKGR